LFKPVQEFIYWFIQVLDQLHGSLVAFVELDFHVFRLVLVGHQKIFGVVKQIFIEFLVVDTFLENAVRSLSVAEGVRGRLKVGVAGERSEFMVDGWNLENARIIDVEVADRALALGAYLGHNVPS
jgi:hypothetical protein